VGSGWAYRVEFPYDFQGGAFIQVFSDFCPDRGPLEAERGLRACGLCLIFSSPNILYDTPFFLPELSPGLISASEISNRPCPRPGKSCFLIIAQAFCGSSAVQCGGLMPRNSSKAKAAASEEAGFWPVIRCPSLTT
jgi:hypothetical protein